MKIAISGPDRQLSESEKTLVRRALAREMRKGDELLSGGAFGVDTCAALQAGRTGNRLVLIAPNDLRYNNELDKFADEIIRVEGDYMDRNDCIADLGEILVAFPETSKEVRRSGTWATIRRFRDRGKIVVLYPLDGTKLNPVSARSKLERGGGRPAPPLAVR